jgi:hypothetical protein
MSAAHPVLAVDVVECVDCHEPVPGGHLDLDDLCPLCSLEFHAWLYGERLDPSDHDGKGTVDPVPVALDGEAWTEEDDPAAPVELSKYAQRRAQIVEDVEWMLTGGESLTGAARRLSMSEDAVVAALFKAGRRDLVTALRTHHRGAVRAATIRAAATRGGRWAA